jgi:hypothetical protein
MFYGQFVTYLLTRPRSKIYRKEDERRGSGSCKLMDFGISGVEPSGSTTVDLVNE